MHRIREALLSLEGYRSVILFGPGVSDLHFDSTNGEQGFAVAVEKTLLENGYHSLFISPHRRPYSQLTDNRQFFEPYRITQSPQVLLDTQLRQMQPGPFGERFVLGESLPIPQNIPQIGDDHVLRILDEIISGNSDTPACLVILNAEIFLSHFEDQKTLNGLFGKWNQLPSSNKNRVIFCFNTDTAEALIETIQSLNNPYLENLSKRHKLPISGDNSLRLIDHPSIHEIEEYISYLEQKRGMNLAPVEIRRIARRIIRENRPLSYWLGKLKGVDILSPRSFDLLGKESNNNPLSALDQLHEMIGLTEVKKKIDDLIVWAMANQEVISPSSPILLNMVFSGPPGVGKTTVAKLIGEIFFEAGLLNRGQTIEHSPSSLIADHVGGTARLVNAAVDQALGGVLFIDEAYGLGDRDRGGFVQEAVETLLSRMEIDQGKFLVILSGYHRQMVRLFRQNPGLDRRFPSEFRITFLPYSLEELHSILNRNIYQSGFHCSDELQDYLPELLGRLSSSTAVNFGNAREVITIADTLRRNWASQNRSSTQKNHRILELSDLPDEYRNLICPDPDSTRDVLDHLDRMKGLLEVKSTITRLVHRVEYESHRRRNGLNQPWTMPTLHQVFLGNPGTGKTTIARLYGELLKSAGYLIKGHTVEINAPTLINGYTGESASMIQNLITEALDGVLFIDEAYALTRGAPNQLNSSSYEIIDTLVKAMEENRSRLVVVVAGYPQEMRNFLEANPGLSSRFSEPLYFADLNNESMFELLKEYSDSEQYILPDDVARSAVERLSIEQSNSSSHFGNARSVRRLYENMKNRLAERIMKTARANPSQNMMDIPGWNSFSSMDIFDDNVQVIVGSDHTQTYDPAHPPMLNWVVKKDG